MTHGAALGGVLAAVGCILVFPGTACSTSPCGPSELRYWCDPNGEPEGCGNEFWVKVKDLPVLRGSDDEMDWIKLDCPKCGGKKTAWQERQCPNCKKFFVTLSTRLYYAFLRSGQAALRPGQPDPASVRDVCPWCNTDVRKWYIEHQPDDDSPAYGAGPVLIGVMAALALALAGVFIWHRVVAKRPIAATARPLDPSQDSDKPVEGGKAGQEPFPGGRKGS